MGVNGFSTDYTYTTDAVYNSTASNQTTKTDTKTTSKETTSDTAVVYEKSNTSASTTKNTYKTDTATIEKLKADAEARTAQLKSLVEKLITKQSETSVLSGLSVNDDSIWNFIREGNYTVDEATIAQAKEDISEDGYWGVKQTSERMIDFAKALTGGDPSKVEEMRAAIEEGYNQAAKLWGGELPEISQQTYDAVMKGLDEWAAEADS